jgi:hypothetical protein
MFTPAALTALLNGETENFIAASTPGGIEAQEARGQRDLCSSSKLPKRFNGCSRSDFESMGIIFGDEADDIFTNVTLPPSWQIRATDHSMWSELVDDAGEVRADIFYKAAFYDRSANITVRQKKNEESPQN